MSDVNKNKEYKLFLELVEILDEYAKEKHQPWWIRLAEACDAFEKSEKQRNASKKVAAQVQSVETLPLPVDVIPAAFKRASSSDKRRGRVTGNTELMKHIGAWFGRKATTKWSVAEAEALAAIMPIDSDDFSIMSRYYTASIPKREDYRRRDLITMLNNWNGEVDRARRFIGAQPQSLDRTDSTGEELEW